MYDIFSNVNSVNEQKFLNHYLRLIERGREQRELKLHETHHILPVCMGGTNEKDNLVKLTPREHYVAHQMLVKIFPTHKGLVYSATMMKMGRDLGTHEWLAERKRKILSKSMLARRAAGWQGPTAGKFGADNPNFGKKRSDEQRQRISNSLKGDKHPQFGKTGTLSPQFGRKRSEETKAKLRRPKSDECKAKISTANKGKKRTLEVKNKMSQSRIGRKLSEETKQKIREKALERGRMNRE